MDIGKGFQAVGAASAKALQSLACKKKRRMCMWLMEECSE
jgi:hypothetical protein